ncbi:MAG: acyl carrier protein [Myxococcaceae bacterium]|nr:acyl carrier protein [Myxococcaceae bacterium]
MGDKARDDLEWMPPDSCLETAGPAVTSERERAPMRQDIDIVREAVAVHLEVDVHSIHGEQNLRRDLGLTALALVMIALDLEDLELLSIPFEPLNNVDTVADLAKLVSRARADAAGVHPMLSPH